MAKAQIGEGLGTAHQVGALCRLAATILGVRMQARAQPGPKQSLVVFIIPLQFVYGIYTVL